MKKSRIIAGIYFALAIGGLIATWYFNLSYRGGDYIGDWFANPASSSAAADIITVLFVTLLFYFTEGRRIGLPWWFLLLLVPLSIGVAVAFAFPLLLGVRELTLGNGRRPTDLAHA